MEFIKPGINIDFIGKRKIALAFSAALIIITIALLIFRGGPNLGVDFSGGVLVQIKLEEKHSPSEIRKGLEAVQLQDSIIQEFDEIEKFQVLVSSRFAADQAENQIQEMKQTLIASFKDIEIIERRRPKTPAPEGSAVTLQIRLNKSVPLNKWIEVLGAFQINEGDIEEQGKVTEYEYLIRVTKLDQDLTGLSDRVQKSLASEFGEGVDIRRVEMVGPKVGEDLRQKALFAIFYAILFIAIYISGRFELKWLMSIIMALSLALVVYLASSVGMSVTWLILIALLVTLGLCWFLRLKYAMGAIIALIHDVAITLGAFTLTDREISLAIIAAFLTIVGYSLNDTIVVFDRIRENLSRFRRRDFGEVMNTSINETLSRTILTSTTTLIVVVALFVLGGGVIHDFAFALLIGVIVGTYSSIFVASPILLVFQSRFTERPKVNRGSR